MTALEFDGAGRPTAAAHAARGGGHARCGSPGRWRWRARSECLGGAEPVAIDIPAGGGFHGPRARPSPPAGGFVAAPGAPTAVSPAAGGRPPAAGLEIAITDMPLTTDVDRTILQYAGAIDGSLVTTDAQLAMQAGITGIAVANPHAIGDRPSVPLHTGRPDRGDNYRDRKSARTGHRPRRRRWHPVHHRPRRGSHRGDGGHPRHANDPDQDRTPAVRRHRQPADNPRAAVIIKRSRPPGREHIHRYTKYVPPLPPAAAHAPGRLDVLIAAADATYGGGPRRCGCRGHRRPRADPPGLPTPPAAWTQSAWLPRQREASEALTVTAHAPCAGQHAHCGGPGRWRRRLRSPRLPTPPAPAHAKGGRHLPDLSRFGAR